MISGDNNSYTKFCLTGFLKSCEKLIMYASNLGTPYISILPINMPANAKCQN